MAIEVTARHMNAGPEVQEYARRKAEEITEEFPKVEHVHVILDIEKRRHMASVFVQARNHTRAEASEASERMIVSIDTAMDKMQRQLRKLHDRRRDHKPAMKRNESAKQKVL